MNFFYQLSLRNKIITIVLTTVILALSIGFSFNLYQELKSTKNNLLTEKILTAKIVGSYTTSDLTFNNRETALDSLSYLKTDPTIINAYIFDHKNKLFVSLYKDVVTTKSQRFISSHEFINKELVVVEPIYLDKEKIGTLHLVSSTEQYLETIQTRIKYFAILIAILVALSFVLAGKLSAIVTSPILSLVNAINLFSTKKFEQIKVDSKHKDETQQLVNSFNDLLFQLKKREEESDNAKNHIHNILNNLVEGVMTISENGLIRSVNLTAEKMFGYSANGLIGNSITTLTTKEQLEKFDGYYNYYTETGEIAITLKGFETIGVKNNRSQFPVFVTISKIPGSDNDEQLLIISCQDISSKKLQDEQIRRTQRMDALGKLTGGIAHDYNNMLGVISGYAELIEYQPVDPETLKSYALEILRATDRGKSLTSKLLAFTKKDSTEANIANINEAIIQNKNIIEKTITAKITLDLKLVDNIWNCWIDTGDFEDALLNLSINAMHAMVDGGTLNIETHNIHMNEIEADVLNLSPGDYIKLTIHDTGVGMDESTRTHIFEPFFTTKKDKGTGLGLSQVYGFVKRSNGEIKVYSEPGQGTHFNLYFPRYVSANKNSPEDVVKATDTSLYNGTETILVVDDEQALRLLAKDLLKLFGYSVLTAESAEDALNILETNKIDLLLSDIIMPNIDGYQLATEVTQRFPEVKIQLASGFSGEQLSDLSDNNKKLHDDLLHKPYRKNQLLQRVRYLLDN